MKRLNLRHRKDVNTNNIWSDLWGKSPDTFSVSDHHSDIDNNDTEFKHKLFDVLSYLNHAHNGHNKINKRLDVYASPYLRNRYEIEYTDERDGETVDPDRTSIFSDRDMPVVLHGIGKFYQHHLKNKLNDYTKQHAHLYEDDKPTLGILHDKYKDEGRHEEYINKLHSFLDSYPELIQGFMKHRIDNPNLYEPVERTENSKIKDDERYPIFSKKEGQQQRDLYKYITEHHPSTKNDEMAGDYAHHVTGVY